MTGRTAGIRGAVIAGLALGALIGAWALAAGGGAPVVLPGTQPADGSGSPDFPAFVDEDGTPGTLDPPGRCGACHKGYRQFGEQMYEPYDTWSGSMMANAGRDPVFWAALDIANQDDEKHLGNVGVGAFCLRCHAPEAYYEGRVDCETPWGRLYDGSCLEGTPDTRDNDFEGITCHFCHRQYDASVPPPGDAFDPDAPYLENGSVYLSRESNLMRGPYGDAQPQNHDFADSPFHESSAFCGQCHNVTSPVRNRRDPDTGADLGYRHPLERTYDEWLQSDYADPLSPEAASCQACHMPIADRDGDGQPDAAFACSTPPGPRGPGSDLEGPVRTHVFRGANTFMLDVLAGEYGAALRRTDAFARVREETLALLQNETLDVELTVPDGVAAGDTLNARVVVINNAGHKFPTGYVEGRRAFLTVRAGEDLDQDGTLDDAEVTFVSGRYDDATGTLFDDPQLHVWETKHGVFDFNGTGTCDTVDGSGHEMFHFVLNDCIALDNRIPPRGFRPTDETAPVGYAYPENPQRPGTLVHWDTIDYAIPVPQDTYRPFLVEAAARFQATSREYVEFLVRDNESTCDPFDAGCDPTQPDARPNRGEKFQALWSKYDRSRPVTLSKAVAGTPVDGPLPVPGEAHALRVTEWDPVLEGARLEFEPACNALDHAVYWGPLDAVDSYGWTGARCQAGITGETTIRPGPGAVFFVVVGNNGQVEGSYGRAADGAERPPAPELCGLPQSLEPACP
ncbi:MAG: hypothetical protein Kow0062_15930 [Acidobacteriota bacterium]